MTEKDFFQKYTGDGSSGNSGAGSSASGSTDTTRGRGKNSALRQEYLKKQEKLNGYKEAISAAEERGDTLTALYDQYQLDVSNVLNSYNDRKTRGGYKSDAQDFYDRTMARTTAARDSIFKLTDWMKENRASIGDDAYATLMDEIRENSKSLSEIQKAAYDDIDFYGQFKDADDYDMWQKYWNDVEQYGQPASESMVAYNEDGSFNAWQTMLNAVQGGKDLLKETKTKEIGERYEADRKGETRTDALGIRRDVMKDYKAAGGKTVKIGGKDIALDAALYNQLYDQHPAPAQTQYELPEKYTAEYMKPQTDAARLLAETYGISTGSIENSRTQRNALDYEQKYADMNFGERMLHNIPITAANYVLDVYSAGLTGADALTGGKLGRGELGNASSVYSLLNFTQNAGSGLTAEAFGVMRDSSNWLGKLVLDLEKTGVEQTMDRVLGAGEGSLAVMGIRTFGSGAQEAEDKGGDIGKQIVTGLTRGGIEAATELMGGVGGSWRGTGYGDGVLKSLNSWVSSKTGSELLGTLTEAFSGEAIEEMLSDVLNPLADRIFQLSDGDQTFWQEVWGDGQILYDGLLGGLAGMGGGVQTHVGNWMQAKNLGTDIATYKAAQRIAESKNLRKKFEEYTGDKLDSDTGTAITQIAVAITNAADTAGQATNAHDVERDIESGGDRYRTTAAEEQIDSTAPVNTQTQGAPTAQTNTETGAQTTAQQTRPTGAMEAIYKGQVGNVVSLTKTDKGWAATIEQPNGKRSNVMEWQAVFDPDTQGILDAFRPSAYADEMLKTYALTDEQVEPKTYALAFNTVADIYGKSTSLTKQQAQEASRRDGGAAAILTDEQFSRAFDAGRNSKDSSIQNSVTRKSSKGAVGFKGVQYQGMTYRAATKDMVSDAELSVLKMMSKAVGVDMVLYQSEEQNGEYQGANGFYRKGTMYLDVHAGATKTTEQSAILLTAAHELTHYLRENNAEAYAGLRDFVTNHLIESGTDIETLAQRKIDREGGAISMEDAAEEVIADSCEMMLENTQVPQMMAKENPGLFAQIREWLAEFAAKLRRAFEGVQARSAEAQTMMQYAEELQLMWDNALAGAAQNVRNNAQAKANNGNDSSENKKGKASYGGRNAKTANLDALARAEQMEERDTDTETIRRETGWFRGMDGKWRFEIDDSGMQFRRDGDAQLLKEEGYRRLQQLTEKWSAEINGGAKLSESERQEMSQLEKEYGGAVWEEKYRLRDFVKHDELFEAYPYLNRVNIAFDSLPDGNMGYFSPRDMTIVLSDNLLGKEADVVLHEIQHVIQKREGFTDGASPSYWNTQLENGYDTRTRSQRRRAAELRNELESISVNEPEFFRDMTDLEGMTPTVPRGKVNWDTLEQIEEDPVEWQEYDARREALEEKYGDLKVFDFGELMYRYHEAEKYPDRTPRDLYYNTAGEIEARDVEARRTLTAEERRAKKPKGADDDTVFANRVGVSYSKNSDSDNSTIKNQIKNNLDKLNDMEPAATISASNLPKGGRNIRDWAVNILMNTGYKVERMGFGVIEFTPKHIAEGIKYLSEDAEVAAFSALPKVLKRGVIIDSHEKHKGNLRDSVTIAAPVIINGVRGNMAVAITVTTKNHYHVHRVLLPDGSKFTFDVGKKKTESTMYSAVNTGEETKDSAYESKISQRAEEVKGKFSMRDNTTDDTAAERKGRQESYANLRAENAKLREQLDYWKGQTKLTKEKTVRKTDADAYAKRLTEQLHNPKAREQVADEIKRMGDYIVQTPGSELSYTEVKDYALAVADYALQDSQTVIDDSQTESLQQLYGYLKDNKLKVTDDTFSDLPEGWVRQHRGRIKLSEDGLDVDTAWGELQEKFGEGMFPSDITAQADMLMHIADTIEAMKPTYGNPFAGYMGEMREAVAQDILDTVLSDEIRQTAMTAADRAQARLDKRIAQDTARYNALRDEKNARIEQIERESRERYNALREKKNQRIEQIKKEGTERTKKAVQRERTFQLQRVERAQKVKSIEKLTKSLSKKMIENNAKYHIPDALKEPIGKFLMSIDTTTSRSGEKARNEFADRLKRVSEVLEAQRKYNQGEGTEGSNAYYDLPPDFTEQMQELANKVKFWTEYNNGQEWKLEDMDLRDLFELENIIKVVSHAVTQANELLSMNTSVDVVGQEAVRYMDKLGEMKTTPGGAEEFLNYKNLTPVYFFKRFGTAGEKIFNALKDGWSKLAFNSKEIIDFAKKLYSPQEVWDAERTIIELQLHRRLNEDENSEALRTEETVPVYMTKAQIMNLYGLSLREQALTHLLGAGIHIKDIKRAGKKALHQGDNYLLTMEELTDIFNEHLTKRDREIVQGMQKFMSTVCAKWYTEVNQKRWGIDGNVEENYWPIETDSRNRQAKGTEGAGSTISLFRLANMGFTKPIKPNSTNAINIGSAFDVFSNHAADMAKYNSMVIPVLDAMKWLSYSNIVATSATSGQYTTMSVQKAMDKSYGPAAQAYFTQLIRDINGSHESGSMRTGLERMTARYKRQAVGGNLRVAFLQPTAYARAGMVLDLKYLAMGGVKQNQIIKSYKEAIKHSGTATWKSLGFYDVNINASLRSLIKQDETAVDKVVGWSMKLAELGDQWTWAMLWNACKTEQQDKAKRAGKKLDYETLMQKTSERFDEVVYQTQVMDSTLTRSEIMRSDDRLVKAATSFMAEPTLSYNTVLNMYDEYRREARAVGKSAAWKKLGNKIMRGIGIYVTQATLGAVVESIMDAWRDDDDYMTFMEKWAEKFWGDYFFDGNLYGDLTVVGKLPVVKDFISALQGEESSRMDTEGLASLYKFGLTSYNKIKAMIEDGEDTTKVTAWGWIEQGLRAASQLFGLPGYNLTREVVAVWNNTIGQWTDSKIRRYKPQPEKEIKNAYLKGYLTADEAKELLMDRKTMGDKTYMIERQALMAIDDWTDNGEKYKALYTALENKDRKAYDEAFDALKESGRYAYDIQTKVRAQIKEWYVGDKRGNGKYKINKEDAVAMLKEYGNMTDYDAESAVHTWTCKVVEGFDYNEKKDLFYAGDLSFADAVKVVEQYGKNDKGKFLSDIPDGYDEARKEVLKWTMRQEVGIDYDDMRSAYNDGDITIEQVAEWSKKYGSLDDEAIETRCYRWEWTKDTPEASGIFEGQARRYDAYVASTGMTKEQYFNLVDGHGTNTFSGDLKPGSTTSYITNSKRNKAWAYIDSLKITPEEKDALAMCYAAENGDGIDKPTKSWMKLEDAPWNK